MKLSLAVIALLLAGCQHRPVLHPVTMTPPYFCLVMNENAQAIDVEISYERNVPRWESFRIGARNEQMFDRPIRLRVASLTAGGDIFWDDHILEVGRRYAIAWDGASWRIVEPTPR